VLLEKKGSEKKDLRLEIYKCRKCRKILFYQNDLDKHSQEFETPESQYSDEPIQFRGKKTSKKKTKLECTSYFLKDRIPALGDFSEADGKIICPKCKCRLGTYNWAGAQCSCGQWITPAIQLTKCKVDLRESLISL